MTYSIVAIDESTGEMGVGVETHRPAVGSIVPWVLGGVGAVATQAMANARYGPQGLAMMQNGLRAEEALAAVLAGDADRERRQVAMVDSYGEVAAFTGSQALKDNGDVQGKGYSCQANMMLKTGVPEAMAAAFEAATGPLEWRIIAALDAAQAAGGDVRGMQSAAILVRPPQSVVQAGPHFTMPGTDFRVDHSPAPLKELRALVANRDAERDLRSEDLTSTVEDARALFEKVGGAALTDEAAFWHAVSTLSVKHGQHDEAAEILGPVMENNPGWAVLMHRLPDVPEDSPLRAKFPV